MKEVKYMISDTARKVDVEAHVLRYWEEELELPIERNEMGHRYYTTENIVLFKNIKELKEQGFQLKAIKMLLPDLVNRQSGLDSLMLLKEELNYKAMTMAEEAQPDRKPPEKRENPLQTEIVQTASAEDKLRQFEKILTGVVKRALKENNSSFGRELSVSVSDRVLKEMDYIARTQEERGEEYFKKLDESIRQMQKSRRQIAAAHREEEKENRKLIFQKKRRKAL